MATIGLCMIVKNEEKLIRRCLESCAPLVDYVCISDTGSTDKTQQVITDFLKEKKLHGMIAEDTWVDFAANRNRALEHLHTTDIDYAFMIDADDMLTIADGFDIAAFKAVMTHDLYDLPVYHGSVVHWRPQIFRNKPGFFWVGVLHEFLQANPPFTRDKAPSLAIKASIEGSRNADPEKFQKDAKILEKALETEKHEYLQTRYTFYLAQSYRDSNNPEKARQIYEKRAKMGGWDQEVYVSCLEAIRCCIRLGGEFEFDAAKRYFDNAVATRIPRAEAAYAFAFLCRQLGKNKEATEAVRPVLGIPIPDGLFIEPWIYQYGAADEFAVNAFWAGHYLECLEACLALLKTPIPADMGPRVVDNAIHAFNKLKPRFAANTSLIFSD